MNRRFTKVGVWNGVTIIDDYGHHPVEIAAVLKAARQATKGRVIAVHQPHRYTRLRDLFTQFCACFNDADVVAIADVYSAGEPPIEGVSRDTLVGGLIAHGHRRALPLAGEEALADFGRAECRPGDLLVCLGAGSISAWANALPARLNGPGDGGGLTGTTRRPPAWGGVGRAARRGLAGLAICPETRATAICRGRLDDGARAPHGESGRRQGEARPPTPLTRPNCEGSDGRAGCLDPCADPGRSWRSSPGCASAAADWLFQPADEADLAAILGGAAGGGAGLPDGRGLEPHRPRRRDRRAW